MRLLQLGGGVPEGISGPEITQAATEGDPAALRCFQTVGGWLGQGLADLAAILDPACFVIGGGVSEAGELLLDPARSARTRVSSVLPTSPGKPAGPRCGKTRDRTTRCPTTLRRTTRHQSGPGP